MSGMASDACSAVECLQCRKQPLQSFENHSCGTGSKKTLKSHDHDTLFLAELLFSTASKGMKCGTPHEPGDAKLWGFAVFSICIIITILAVGG